MLKRLVLLGIGLVVGVVIGVACTYAVMHRVRNNWMELSTDNHGYAYSSAAFVDRYGIPEPPFPKTVYRTPNPEHGISEDYEISIEPAPGAPDPQRCWIVRELHGYYEEATKTYHQNVETLHPNEPPHFLTLEEAIREADKQVLFRAKEGFHFLFTM